jgi:hypothetical protein
MKDYKKLPTSDIYRDGGSLEARFQCADGSFESFPELSVEQLKSETSPILCFDPTAHKLCATVVMMP